MIDPAVRHGIDDLLGALRSRPTELPLAEVAALSRQPVTVEIDRTGIETVVMVTPRPDNRFDRLSPRELEVAELMAAGLRNGDIASSLFISVATVKDHAHAVLAKTGLRSRAAVAAAWHRS